MFIPTRDSTLRLKKPYVVYILIVMNFLIFFYQATLPSGSYAEWFGRLGVVPAHLFQNGILASLIPFFTSLFLHGGFAHLGGNMLYLWIFGDNIESTLGHFRFFIFYFACGIIASLTQVMFNPASEAPIIGASGAISGILGAYLIRYPRAKIQILFWVIIFFQRFWIPAVYVLGIWFAIQLSNGLGALTFRQQGGVAWFAHIGGFISGIALLLWMEPYERKRLWKQLNRNY
ncbi:MAG: rhomboid family intramembrane serine protease [Candidatus Marinimicrobia bacterium CG08_land_8_20_14_0_20_45_22]|nr:MAG: rhomboid family intramembrane serine protease [Candidatus Marinimicrobia bacterium CG08_land_8_20_14_0_20_45_22]